MSKSENENRSRVTFGDEIDRLNRLNQELKYQNEQLLSENANDHRKENYINQIEDLKKTISNLENELKKRDAELSSCQIQLSHLKKIEFESDLKNKSLIAGQDLELEDLRKEKQSLNHIKQLYEDLTQQYQVLQGELAMKRKEINVLRGQLENSQRNSEKRHYHTAGEDYWKLRYLKMEELLRTSESPIKISVKSDLSQENKPLKEIIKDLTSQLNNLQAISGSYIERNNDLVAENKQLHLELENADRKLFELENELTSVLNQRWSSAEGISDESFRGSSRVLVSQLKEKIDGLKKEEQRKIQTVNNYWEARFRETLQKELVEQARQFGAEKPYAANLDALHKRIDDYQAQIILLQVKIEKLSQETHQKDQILNENEEMLKNQEERIFFLLEENYKLGYNLENAEKQLGELHYELKPRETNSTHLYPETEPIQLKKSIRGNSLWSTNKGRSTASDTDTDMNLARLRSESDDPENVIDTLMSKILSQNSTVKTLENKIRYLESGKDISI